MGKNILIVESKNDKYFFQAIINKLNLDIEVAPPIRISDQDYLEMNGLDHKKLKDALSNLRANIQKGEIEKVGIIIDIDNYQQKTRITFVNECIQEVFPNSELISEVNRFINLNITDSSDDSLNVKLACYFTNIDGQGDLETVLKAIKYKESIHADCLEVWRNCLTSNEKVIKDKDFDKFWVNIYVRFDTCSNNDKKQAGSKCSMSNFDYIMKNKVEIWDLDHPKLDNFKYFLELFS
ncbi:MAG: DUF3226 domain-containing protein [Pseudanabaenaceae cyanobacterium bins.39]|nr:DUF3226 domain-containing protein [Pseudanabaenaceae cyanobacterium bins.39]